MLFWIVRPLCCFFVLFVFVSIFYYFYLCLIDWSIWSIDNMEILRSLTVGAFLVYGFVFLYSSVESCNEVVCASIVSKCMLTQSCKCELKNCSCCKECLKCLGKKYYEECCSCVGKSVTTFSKILEKWWYQSM